MKCAIAFALVLAACGAPPPAAAPTLENTSPPPTDYLVWTTSATGHDSTRWIDAGGQERGRALGLLVSARGRLWRLDEHNVSAPLYTCDQLDHGDKGPPKGDVSDGTLAQMTALDGSGPVPLDQAVPDDGYADLTWGARVTGSLGPYLFVEEQLSQYSCGAHGGEDYSASIVDLDSGRTVPPMMADGDPAIAAAVHDAGSFAQLDELPAPGDLHVGEIRPQWHRGALGLAILVWIDACYACGNGNWSSYTTADWFDTTTLPAALAALPPVPSAVTASLESAEAGGVSWGHPDDTWRRVFTRQ